MLEFGLSYFDLCDFVGFCMSWSACVWRLFVAFWEWSLGLDLFCGAFPRFVLGDLLQLFVWGKVLDWRRNEYTACLTWGRLLDWQVCGVLSFLVVCRCDLSSNLFSSLGGRPSFAICDSPCLIIVSNEDSFSSVALSIESFRSILFPLDLAFLEYFFSFSYTISGLFDERGDFLCFFIEPGRPLLWELDLLLLCSVLRRCWRSVANVFT